MLTEYEEEFKDCRRWSFADARSPGGRAYLTTQADSPPGPAGSTQFVTETLSGGGAGQPIVIVTLIGRLRLGHNFASVSVSYGYFGHSVPADRRALLIRLRTALVNQIIAELSQARPSVHPLAGE